MGRSDSHPVECVATDVIAPNDAPDQVREIAARTLSEHSVQWAQIEYVTKVEPRLSTELDPSAPPHWMVVYRGQRPHPGNVVLPDGRWSGSAAAREYVDGTSKIVLTVTTCEHASVVFT